MLNDDGLPVTGYGDRSLGSTFTWKFTTSINGVPTAFDAGSSPAVEVYEAGSATPITVGITLTTGYNGVIGLNNLVIVASAANGYAPATDYSAVISSGKAGGSSMVGICVGRFSLE